MLLETFRGHQGLCQIIYISGQGGWPGVRVELFSSFVPQLCFPASFPSSSRDSSGQGGWLGVRVDLFPSFVPKLR